MPILALGLTFARQGALAAEEEVEEEEEEEEEVVSQDEPHAKHGTDIVADPSQLTAVRAHCAAWRLPGLRMPAQPFACMYQSKP